jgi:hypothetical protein
MQDISWIDAFFTFIIISSAVIFAKSLKTYSFSINILCYLNLLVAFGFVITAFIVALLDDITQIKFGYYLFIINTFAILALQKSIDDAQ